MPQGALRDVVIVEPVVVPHHGIQVLSRVEVGGFQDFADTSVEALHHPIGLGMARRCQSMFDGVLLAQLVEGVVAQGLAVLLGEAVGEAWSLSVSSLVMMNGAFFWRFLSNRRPAFWDLLFCRSM